MDLISVIVPVYNLENEITRCVNSIQRQSYKNIEIIIVDDGSTDNSRNVIDELSNADNRIKTIYKKNEGVSVARLTGVKKASGEWIGFVDGDDEIEPNMFEKLISNAVKANADISHCGYKMIFDDGRENYFYNSGKIIEQDRFSGITDLLEGKIIEPGLWNKLYRRSLFNSLIDENIMDISIKENEDLLMNFYLFVGAQKAIFEDFCPYHYIVRASSATRRKLDKEKLYDPIKVKQIILRDSPEELKSNAQTALFLTCLNAMNILSIEGGELYKECMGNIRELIIDNYNRLEVEISRKPRVLVKIVRYFPNLYRHIYRFYSRFFQMKKYS